MLKGGAGVREPKLVSRRHSDCKLDAGRLTRMDYHGHIPASTGVAGMASRLSVLSHILRRAGRETDARAVQIRIPSWAAYFVCANSGATRCTRRL